MDFNKKQTFQKNFNLKCFENSLWHKLNIAVDSKLIFNTEQGNNVYNNF